MFQLSADMCIIGGRAGDYFAHGAVPASDTWTNSSPTGLTATDTLHAAERAGTSGANAGATRTRSRLPAASGSWPARCSGIGEQIPSHPPLGALDCRILSPVRRRRDPGVSAEIEALATSGAGPVCGRRNHPGGGSQERLRRAGLRDQPVRVFDELRRE